MLCGSRDDVQEEGCNIWFGEETDTFKPQCDIVILHGLGSHPYYAFLCPTSRTTTSQTSGVWNDSVRSLRPSHSSLSKKSFSSNDEPVHSPALTTPDSAWANEYSEVDLLGRIGTFWPRDLLPVDVRGSRICTIGYRSQWTSSRFQTSLQECGEHLLTTLDRARASASARHRPLIFVAHSFGGLVILSALVAASRDSRLSALKRSVAGCIFLGSPFAGSEYVGLLDMATSAGGNTQGILHTLRTHSPELEGLRTDFAKAYERVPLVSFYERLKTDLGRKIMVLHEQDLERTEVEADYSQVVTKESTLLSNARSIGLYKTHSDLVKFASSADESYQVLVAELKAMLRSTRSRKHPAGRATQQSRTQRLHTSLPAHRELVEVPAELDSQLSNHFNGSESYPPVFREQRSEVSAIAVTVRNPSSTERTASDYPRPVNASPTSHHTRQQLQRPPIGNLLRSGDHRHTTAVERTSQDDSATYLEEGGNTVRMPTHLQRGYGVLKSQRSTALSHVPDLSSVQSQPIPKPIAVIVPAFNARSGADRSQQSFIAELDTAERQPMSPIPLSLLPRSSCMISDPAEPRFQPTVARHSLAAGPARAPLRYLTRAENSLRNSCESAIMQSRAHLFGRLIPDNRAILCAPWVSLAGRSGIGKTHLAMACVNRIIEASEDASIMWVTGGVLQGFREDCRAIAELVGSSTLHSRDHWDWLCSSVELLASGGFGRCLLVLDGLDHVQADYLGLYKLRSIALGETCHILTTTRNRATAKRLSSGSEHYMEVPAFEPLYSAEVLSLDHPFPKSPIFDEIAHLLEYDPLLTVQSRDYLRESVANVVDYTRSLTFLLDAPGWSTDGRASTASQTMTRDDTSYEDRRNGPSLPIVLRSCLNSSWPLLFDDLSLNHPAAAELLSQLSVCNKTKIPTALLTGSAGDIAATEVLLNYCYLDSRDRGWCASKLMLLAYRSWLLHRDGLRHAFISALTLVANRYPDAAFESNRRDCLDLEPFSDAVTSPAAESWIGIDETSRWNRGMLSHKRTKVYRLCGNAPPDI